MISSHSRIPFTILFGIFLLVCSSYSYAQTSKTGVDPGNRFSIEAVFTQTAPRIDGNLDDEVWQRIDPIQGFQQRWPNEGAEPTEETWAKIAYDSDFLYFAFQFLDKEPELIRAHNLLRGGQNGYDDHAYIALDTYLDGRNAYLFEMNALGAQDDAMIADEAMTLDSYSWDAVFRSETVINENGWFLEVSIPFRQLRFPEGDELEFGLFMRRTIRRKDETLNWPLVPLSFGPEYSDDLRSVSQYGRLTGLKNIRRGKNIEVTPYITRAQQSLREDISLKETISDHQTDIGGDLKYSVSSNLTVDLTINTDFAHVEADSAKINLTRFGLFFPEKRPFFLERSGLFEHGASRETQTFFSRTIGLAEDILAGTRITGQLGKFSVGFLNIQTGNRMKDLFGSDAANNLVARVKADVFPRATVGAIVTNISRGKIWNTSLGADTEIRFGSRSKFSAWFTDVRDADSSLDDQAGHVGITIQDATYGAGYSFTSVGKNYMPAIGFVRRQDMRKHEGSLVYTPIIDSGPFRQIMWTNAGTYIASQDNEKQSWVVSTSARFRTRRSDFVELSAERGFERLLFPFFIRPDAEIASGDYTSNRIAGTVSLDRSQPLSGGITLEGGQFFGGTRTDVVGNVSVKSSKHIAVRGTVSYSQVDLPIPNGEFSATTAALDLSASVSRKLFANILIQYDNFSHDLRSNIRIDWIHTPGSDLFLIFNTSHHLTQSHEDLFDPNRDLIMNNAIGVAKLTYLIML